MSLNTFISQPGKKSGFLKNLIIILMVAVISTECATSHKHQKMKAVPCPCEKENRR